MLFRYLYYRVIGDDQAICFFVLGQMSTASAHQFYVTHPVPMLNVPTLKATTSENCNGPNAIPDHDSVTGRHTSYFGSAVPKLKTFAFQK